MGATTQETAEAESRLLPLPAAVQFWHQEEEALMSCDHDRLTAEATAAYEWLKLALRDMWKSKRVKAAVDDLFNAFEFTNNLREYGIYEDLHSFCQEAANDVGRDMQAFFESAGLAASLGTFQAMKTVMDLPIMRQDCPLVGVPAVPRRPGHTPLQHENVVMHVIILLARALDDGFQEIIGRLAGQHRGFHKRTPTKGHARMMNKAVAKDDHRLKVPPVVMHNIDIVRCAVTFDTVDDLKSFLNAVEAEFGPPARDKNMFAFNDAQAAAQLHYRTFMRNCVYAPAGLTYGRLARDCRAAWQEYLERPPEDPNEPWARFRLDARRAVEFLQGPEIADLPARMVCEVQCLLQKYLEGRLKMHGLYKVIRASDEQALYRNFKKDRDGAEKVDKGKTWTEVQEEAVNSVQRQVSRAGSSSMLLTQADKGHRDAVRLLVSNGADVNMSIKEGGASPLFVAADNGHFDVVDELLDLGADVDHATMDDGETALSVAAFKGHIDVVQRLLARRADANKATTDNGITPLWRAAKFGHRDVLQVLLDFGADADLPRTTDGCTPLFMAAESGHIDVVHALLERNAAINNANSDDGVTPLNMAASQGFTDVVEELLARRADVNIPTTEDGETPLYMAAGHGHFDVLEELLKANAEVNKATTDDGTPPLYIAANHGHLEIVDALIRHRADVDQATTDDGATALFVAASNGHADVVGTLLRGRCAVDPKLTTDGTTPLFMAAYSDHLQTVRLLLEGRADPCIQCEHGKALDRALSRGNSMVVELLEEYEEPG